MSGRVDYIRRMHKHYKRLNKPAAIWKAEVTVGDVDALLKRIDKLERKLARYRKRQS